ncbi:MAG: sulfite exporter TauE/SafE family protein, partial [Aeriscardovia sp.]|nr:sulfite exporter TauE/SafE family protein [Aeriscardovia sp.]
MYFGMLTISQYLILAAAFFFAGIVDAAAGGGGLFTVPTFLLIGFPIHMVSGTNQSSIVFGSVTASLRYLKKGLVDIKAAVLIGIVSILGSFLGVQLNIYLPEKFLQ